MSLLSDFLGTEDFSLMDSPMFQELIENIKTDRTYSANNLICVLNIDLSDMEEVK